MLHMPVACQSPVHASEMLSCPDMPQQDSQTPDVIMPSDPAYDYNLDTRGSMIMLLQKLSASSMQIITPSPVSSPAGALSPGAMKTPSPSLAALSRASHCFAPAMPMKSKAAQKKRRRCVSWSSDVPAPQ
jgi:hypothetical protein